MKHLCHMLRRSQRDESGATLIEFAIVLPIFLFLVFSILEFSLIMFASSAVNNAVTEAARSGMTGSSYGHTAAQGENARKAYIDESLRRHLGPFGNMGDITIDSTAYDQLQEVGMDGKGTGNASYGQGGQIVKYDVTFDWRVMSPMVSVFFGTRYPIKATALIKNERFR